VSFVDGLNVAVDGRLPVQARDDRFQDRFSDRDPIEKWVWIPCSRNPRRWARNALLAPAESDRIRMSVPYRCASGICTNAASTTAIWSAAVFDLGLPGRRMPARASPVASRKHSSG
jgi:hypothetical protein